VVVTITDKEAIDAVLRGDAVEVSAGYEVDIVETPGVTPDGQAYDAIQRNIRCNHIALTRRGRAGPEVRLHLDKKEETNKMAQLTLDNAVFEVPEAVAAAVATHLRAQRRDQEEEEEKEKKFGALLEGMGTRLERLEACSEKMRRDQEGIQEQLAQMMSMLERLLLRLEAMLPSQENQAVEPEAEGEEEPSTETLDSLVEERFRVVTAARKILGDSYDWRGRSTEDIRLDALRAAGIPTEGYTSEYLRARFDALVESAGANSLRSALDSLPVATGGLLQVRPPSNPPRFAYQK